MPVMIFYKAKSIPVKVAESISETMAAVTKANLGAAVEVRVVEPIYSYNSNEIHIEVRFRDFAEYSDEQIARYHAYIMKTIGSVLKKHKIKCSYSFYIIPTLPPRSMWAQDSTKE